MLLLVKMRRIAGVMKLLILGAFLLATIIFVMALRIWCIKRDSIRIRSYMGYMENLYEGIEERVGTVRKYRHDLAKHIQMLELLMEKETDSVELRSYIEEQKLRYEKLKKVKITEDEILDTLLSIKKEECDGKNISLKISVQKGSCGFMEETDKVGLILNLLDNAIAAVEELKIDRDKEISISFIHEDECSRIELINCIKKNKIGFVIPYISDKCSYGIGIKVIQEIVSKYDGERVVCTDEVSGIQKERILLKAN